MTKMVRESEGNRPLFTKCEHPVDACNAMHPGNGFRNENIKSNSIWLPPPCILFYWATLIGVVGVVVVVDILL